MSIELAEFDIEAGGHSVHVIRNGVTTRYQYQQNGGGADVFVAVMNHMRMNSEIVRSVDRAGDVLTIEAVSIRS